MNKLTPFVIQRIEEKLTCRINDKGVCAELRRLLHNSESEDGRFSLNTIKRWFGVIEKQVEPQQNGLEAIAQYLNYPSWSALTQEAGYSHLKEKTEEDYINEILSDYNSLVQSIGDYQFKKGQTKNKVEIAQCNTKLKVLKYRQQTIKDAIVQLADLLTDPTPYQIDSDKIESLFESKQYEEADKLLNTDNLEEEQAILLRTLKMRFSDKIEIQKQLKKNAYCFYIKAKICKIWYNWDEAEEYYLLSLNSQRNFDTLFALGELYLAHKKDDKNSLKMFDEILKHIREILSLKSSNFFCEPKYHASLLINTLFNVGKIDFIQKRLKDGFERMDLVLEIYNTIKSPALQKDIQIEIGNVYNEQGNAYSAQKDHDKAELFLKKALEMYKPFSEFDYSGTVINLAYVYADKGHFESAERELNQSLEYFKLLFRKDDSIEKQQKYRLKIAKCHFALGFVNHAKNDLHESLLSYKRALIICEKMNEITPTTTAKIEIAKTYTQIRNIYTRMSMPKKAQEFNKKLIELFISDDGVFDYLFEYEPEFKEMAIKIMESKKI
jgi:tetratricopeptide (TPR) repeat protein